MKDMLQTICQGALGALTFGVYHHIVSMKAIETHNEKMKLQQEKHYKEFKAKKNK
jgi:hypothetical protein